MAVKPITVAATLAVLTGAVVVMSRKAKAKPLQWVNGPGIRFLSDCSKWEILNDATLRAASEAKYKSLVMTMHDPWDITDDIVKQLAPPCRKSDEPMRSVAELDLYREVFVETINRLYSENRIDPELYQVYKDEIIAYYHDEQSRLTGAA